MSESIQREILSAMWLICSTTASMAGQKGLSLIASILALIAFIGAIYYAFKESMK